MSVVNLHECPIFRASDTSDHDKATWERTVRLCEPGVNAAVYRRLVRRTLSVPVLFFLCFPPTDLVHSLQAGPSSTSTRHLTLTLVTLDYSPPRK